jgi:hypothetical protein
MGGDHERQALGTASLCVGRAAAGTTPALAEQDKAEITVLYDVFGKTSTMKKDWASPPSSIRRQAHPVRHGQQCRDLCAQRRGQGYRPDCPQPGITDSDRRSWPVTGFAGAGLL